MTDLFGNESPVSPAPENEKPEPLRDRVLQYFASRKFQSFIQADLVKAFPESKATAVINAIAYLKKHRYLICTGDFRGGSTVDHSCLTLNLHRR